MSWRIIERELFVGAFVMLILKGYDPQGVMETAAGYGITFEEIRDGVKDATPPGAWRLSLLQSLDTAPGRMIE